MSGEVTGELVRQVTIEYLKLRAASGEPITLVIDSVGGNVEQADNLLRLFATPSQAGVKPRIITVVHNLAASAAAHLLAMGDYAIAYVGSVVHCHGTRIAGGRFDVTKEFAVAIADNLERSNAERALKLARGCFQRVVLTYSALTKSIQELRQADVAAGSVPNDELAYYVRLIKERICSQNQKLVEAAWDEHETVRKLFDHVSSNLPDLKGMTDEQVEAETLKVLLEYKLAMMKSSSWRLSRGGLKETMEEYFRLWDYISGEHNDDVDKFVARWGRALLSDEDFAAYREMTEAGNLPDDWLKQKVRWKIDRLWYYSICLARRLQKDENPLTAVDAYWLGLVDEVVGVNLPSIRVLVEEQNSSTDVKT